MTPSDARSCELAFEQRSPAALRVVLVVAGLGVIGAPTVEFLPALLQPGWWTLVFGTIVFGAWILGLTLVLGGVFGEDVGWTVLAGPPPTIGVARRSIGRVRRQRIAADQIADITVRAVDHDGGPDTYRVCVELVARGPRLETSEFGTRAAAEALALRLRAALAHS